MPILISKIKTVVSFNDSETGDYNQTSDYVFCDEEYTFQELLDELKNYTQQSSLPMHGTSFDWVTSEPEQDFNTGASIEYSLHYSKANPERNLKYWKLALRLSGFRMAGLRY